jgi:hypothetical protein
MIWMFINDYFELPHLHEVSTISEGDLFLPDDMLLIDKRIVWVVIEVLHDTGIKGLFGVNFRIKEEKAGFFDAPSI